MDYMKDEDFRADFEHGKHLDPAPLICDSCGSDDEVAPSHAVGHDDGYLCHGCALDSGYEYCEGCDTYTDDWATDERCQSCYERSIDAAHDYLSGDR